jgi:hypothetical protein
MMATVAYAGFDPSYGDVLDTFEGETARIPKAALQPVRAQVYAMSEIVLRAVGCATLGVFLAAASPAQAMSSSVPLGVHAYGHHHHEQQQQRGDLDQLLASIESGVEPAMSPKRVSLLRAAHAANEQRLTEDVTGWAERLSSSVARAAD